MSVKCSECPLRQIEIFKDMTESEVEFMSKFKTGELQVDAGTPILVEGARSPQMYTVMHGMGLRYKTLEDGRRQVLNFVMPGDFIGLQSTIDDDMSYGVDATTEMTLCVFRRSEIWSLFRNYPSRGYDLTWIVSTEEHFLGEALATVGQRSAIERIAWALVYLHDRTRALGLNRNGVFDFPFRQQDLADTLGLSLVHTNKTLARLRERGLATWSDQRIAVHEPDTLASLAVMDRDALLKLRPLM